MAHPGPQKARSRTVKTGSYSLKQRNIEAQDRRRLGRLLGRVTAARAAETIGVYVQTLFAVLAGRKANQPTVALVTRRLAELSREGPRNQEGER